MIVKHYAGSIAYGTNLPTSDTDFRGIFSADPVNIRTPFYTVNECTDAAEEDTKLYELTRFMKLAVDCNPNVVETLWVDDGDITITSPTYELLRDHRHELLSKKIAFTTSGYALAQLKRIKGHNKWITNPQSVRPPKQTDFVSMVFNFDERKLLKRDFDLTDYYADHRLVPYGGNVFGLYQAKEYHPFHWATHNLNTNFDAGEGFHTINYKHEWMVNIRELITTKLVPRRRTPIAIIKFNKDEYKRAAEIHKNYWTWKENRNAARSELEEQFGYDTKHAMHLVRLLRMGAEALTLGELIVKRPDADELLAIRNGAWKYEEIVKYAESMDRECREVLYKTSTLRKNPDLEFASRLLMEAQDLVWANNT